MEEQFRIIILIPRKRKFKPKRNTLLIEITSFLHSLYRSAMNTYMIKTAILFVLLNVTFGETNIASTKLSGPNVCQRTEE